MGNLRILIADDHAAVRILLRNILESVPDWRVCGEAENGKSAVALAGRLHPDVIVMDLVMPESNGLEATREVLRSDRQARVILTTLHEIPSFVDEARRVGRPEPAGQLDGLIDDDGRRGLAGLQQFEGAVVPLEQVWRLAGSWYADRLEHGWTPRTPEAMERLLADAGLTGEFWRVR